MTAGRPAGRAHPIKEVIRTMADISNAALAEAWRQLWNGDLEQLDTIVAEGFVTHAALKGGMGDDTLRGRAALGQWIGSMHAIMSGLVFTVDVGPTAAPDPRGRGIDHRSNREVCPRT